MCFSVEFLYKIIISFFFLLQGIVGSELDEHALMSRKSRTQVFSGRKLAVAEGG